MGFEIHASFDTTPTPNPKIVPRALFPGFGPRSQGKATWGRGWPNPLREPHQLNMYEKKRSMYRANASL